MNETGVDIFRDRLERNLPVALGLERALAQLRGELARAADQILGSRDVAWCGGRSQFSKAHVKFLPLTPDCASVTMESSKRCCATAHERPRRRRKERDNRGDDAAWIFHDAGASAGTFVHRN